MKQVKLSDVAEISSGRAFKGGLKKTDNGTLVVTMADVSGDDNSIDWTKVDRAEVALRSHEPLKNGDILFLAKGKHYKAVVVDGLKEDAIATLHFFIIRPNEKIDSDYLALQLNSKDTQQYFADNARGETKKHITRTVMNECRISTCTANTQKAIVELNESVEQTFKEVAKGRALLAEAFALFTQGLYSEAESRIAKIQGSPHGYVFEGLALQLQSLITDAAIANRESSANKKTKIL